MGHIRPGPPPYAGFWVVGCYALIWVKGIGLCAIMGHARRLRPIYAGIRDVSDQFFVPAFSEPSIRRALARTAKTGKIRRLVPGLYTDNLSDQVERVIRRGAMMIASALFPDAVLTGRSGIELQPAKQGDQEVLFLSDGGSRRNVDVGPLQFRFDGRQGKMEGDLPYLGKLYRASAARALLENLAPSRARGSAITRTLGQAGVERLIEKVCLREGEARLNELRDEARTIASTLGLDKEYETLSGIIGTLLGSRNVTLVTGLLRARAAGSPWDQDCLNRMVLLRRHLETIALPERPDTSTAPGAREALSFVEAYFSNYIEGTRFLVNEAKEIVFDRRVPEKRPLDGRDVLETFKQVAALGKLPQRQLKWLDLREELLSRHGDLMGGRPDKLPGKFKIEPHGAGNTVFVDPGLVEGTLAAGVDLLADVTSPFARALLIHFLLTDVHPFADGNGRISRIMMNKELVVAGHSGIVIPSVHREEYLDTLRQLSRSDRSDGLVRLLDFCQRVTAAATAKDFDEAIAVWASTYAFQDANEQRFRMPNRSDPVEWRNGIPGPTSHWREMDAEKERNTATSAFGVGRM
jgi:hypothetical protein